MKPSPPSWPQRVLNAGLPLLSDRVWATFLLVMLFVCGMIAGMAVCTYQSTQVVQRLTLQQQLDGIEQRLRALEHQQP